jgi:hypothetical protein
MLARSPQDGSDTDAQLGMDTDRNPSILEWDHRKGESADANGPDETDKFTRIFS